MCGRKSIVRMGRVMEGGVGQEGTPASGIRGEQPHAGRGRSAEGECGNRQAYKKASAETGRPAGWGLRGVDGVVSGIRGVKTREIPEKESRPSCLTLEVWPPCMNSSSGGPSSASSGPCSTQRQYRCRV